MAMLTSFHFLYFDLNFGGAGFSLLPQEHFDYEDRFLAAWQEKVKKSTKKPF